MERRLSAIFAADMVGYSRLMEADEIGTLGRQKAHRKEFINPTFDKFHGRIVKEMGDGLLVEFPSVVDAVQCAVTIQRAMLEREADVPEDRRITYRVGINLGDIIVEGDDIHGDGVNVAARLEAMADPGGICISGAAYDQLRSTVEVGYESLGEVQVKNIERPIRAYRVLTETADAGTVIEQPRRRMGPVMWGAIAAVMLLVIGAAGWWAQQPDFEPADPEKFAYKLPDTPSIAVLPFDNLSGDPADDYLGDSLTENIIANLGSLPDLIVIARNSTFVYKGKPTKVQTVAEELGVRYVLEGSVQREDDHIRVFAQLVDALDGKHLWAEKYDEQAENLFDVQDAISEKIAEQLEYHLSFGELAKQWREQVGDPEAYRRSREINELFQQWNLEGHRKAEAAMHTFAADYPDFEVPKIWLGYLYWQKALLGFDGERSENIVIARQFANEAKAIIGDDDNARIHTLVSNLDLMDNDCESALRHADRSLELTPSASNAVAIAGSVKAWCGQPEEAIKLYRLAMRLEPHYPIWYPTLLAEALAFVGRYDEARPLARAVLEHEQDIGEKVWALNVLTTIAYSRGDIEAARGYAKMLLATKPEITVPMLARRYVRIGPPFYNNVVEALTQAGIPEHPPLKLPDKPSIAVLPFDNMSNDSDQEYFVDGLTEDLITRLAKLDGLFVVARNTVFTYKGKSVDISQIGRELGVRHILEGSVRKSGGRLRINAQLIETKDSGHLWAEIYDRDLQDVFAVQDDVALRIVEALRVQLSPDEKVRVASAPTENMVAFDFYLKAREQHLLFDRGERAAKALENYEAAYGLDPTFADAFAFDADLASWIFRLRWQDALPAPEARTRSVQSMETALRLDPDNATALLVKADLLSHAGKRIEAIETAKRAVRAAPGSYRTHLRLAIQHAINNECDSALASVNVSLRLNPVPNAESSFSTGGVFLLCEKYDKAAVFAEQTVQKIPNSHLGYIVLALASAGTENKERAAYAVDKILEISPMANWRIEASVFSYYHPDVHKRFVDLLRKSGLPEWPFRFEGDPELELTPEELRREIFGRNEVGIYKPYGPYEVLASEDGRWEMHRQGDGAVFTGTSKITDKGICIEVDGVTSPPQCTKIYRNPGGTLEAKNQYTRVSMYGIFTFAVKD